MAQTVKKPPAMQEIWVGKIHWRRQWQPTPVFLPGEFHGHRSLAGYSPWRHKECTQLSVLTSLHFMESRKHGINKPICRARDTDIENRLDTVRGGEDGTNWESSIDMYTLPHVRERANEKLLNNTAQLGALWQPRGVGSCVLVAGCSCMAEANAILWSNYPPIKNKI